MRTIGLVGGMSWVSTIEYYRALNQMVNERLGSSNSAKVIINSVNFEDYVRNNHNSDHEANLELIVDAAKVLERAGCEAILLGSNTAHILAGQAAARLKVPLIHVADATGKAASSAGISKVGLLGTKFVMEMDFYRGRLANFGIESLIPDDADRQYIHDSIFNELGNGTFLDSTRERYREISKRLVSQGAQGLILGCTEIPLLIRHADVDIPTFDTTRLHAAAAVEFMLADGGNV